MHFSHRSKLNILRKVRQFFRNFDRKSGNFYFVSEFLVFQGFSEFFHIDFGHIMGNFKTKAGFQVENEIFVFTHDMLHAISDRYNEFESICVELYHITRKNGNLILTMLYLLTSCELPELKDVKDLVWPSKKMMLGQTNEEAENDLKKQLKIASSASTRSILKNAAHLFKHS